ncbi:MAG: alpha/beta hydrolase [Candidatus Saccharimonadales bacterium]
MKNAIILHGTCSKRYYYDPATPSMSNSNWTPWLQKQLLAHDINASTPEVPHAYILDYEIWKREVERFEIGPETILVGHSTGGGFWVRYLSDHPELQVGRVVLVAPWFDPANIKKSDFFEFAFDTDIASRTQGLVIFNSDNDHPGIHWSVEMLRQTQKTFDEREFHNYGHFCLHDMKTEAFPELLAEILR